MLHITQPEVIETGVSLYTATTAESYIPPRYRYDCSYWMIWHIYYKRPKFTDSIAEPQNNNMVSEKSCQEKGKRWKWSDTQSLKSSYVFLMDS